MLELYHNAMSTCSREVRIECVPDEIFEFVRGVGAEAWSDVEPRTKGQRS